MGEYRLAVDHVGLTVPDLDQAVVFFVDAFGCQEVFRAGPHVDCGFTWPGENAPEKTTVRPAMLQHGDSANIELLEYADRARQDPPAPRPKERGGAHLAFYDDDIKGTVERLTRRPDVQFLGSVEKRMAARSTGWTGSTCSPPGGLVIELLRWQPGQLPYEADTTVRLVAPPWLR